MPSGTQSYALNLNQVYFFSFHSDINKLNGLYAIQAIMKYEEVEVLLEDPVQFLYQAVGKMDLYDSNNLVNKYRYDVYYKILSLSDNTTVYYVPDSLIPVRPSEDYIEVPEYMVMIQVGILDEPSELDALANDASKLTRRVLGITPSITTATYNKKYVPKTVLSDFIKARNIIKTSTFEAKTIKDLEEENTKLRTKLVEYEKIILEYEKYKEKLKGVVASM